MLSRYKTWSTSIRTYILVCCIHKVATKDTILSSWARFWWITLTTVIRGWQAADLHSNGSHVKRTTASHSECLPYVIYVPIPPWWHIDFTLVHNWTVFQTQGSIAGSEYIIGFLTFRYVQQICFEDTNQLSNQKAIITSLQASYISSLSDIKMYM